MVIVMKNRLLKRISIGVMVTLCVLALCFGAYWKYLDYKFEQNPLYYYKPRICDYLDSETADKVAKDFNRRAKQLRDSLGRIPTADEMESFTPDNRSGDICPKCKSPDVGKFVYGRLVMDSVATENVRNRKWIPAGCSICSKSPRYKCNICSYEWGNHVDFIKRIKTKD